MRRIILFCLISLFTISCSNKEKETKKRVLMIKDLAELGTVEYNISKVIRVSDDQTWYKFGNRKILFSCEAILKAGVDLSKLTENDITFENNEITIRLPKAKLLYLNMAPDKIEEEYNEVSFTRFSFTNEEKDGFLVQGEKSILEAIPSIGILEAAEKNAKQLFASWLAQSNFNSVNIIFVEPKQ
jgi:hypothetical protein